MRPRTASMQETNELSRSGRLDIPWDLGEWADKAALLNTLVEDINLLDWGNEQIVAYLRRNPAYQPKLLLQLLTYAYATGVFESEQVETLYYRDPVFRTLGWDKPVTRRDIVQFRRENRGLFKWTLSQVLQAAARRRLGLRDGLFPAGLKRRLLQNAVERLDLARHFDRASIGD